MFSTINSSQNT